MSELVWVYWMLVWMVPIPLVTCLFEAAMRDGAAHEEALTRPRIFDLCDVVEVDLSLTPRGLILDELLELIGGRSAGRVQPIRGPEVVTGVDRGWLVLRSQPTCAWDPRIFRLVDRGSACARHPELHARGFVVVASTHVDRYGMPKLRDLFGVPVYVSVPLPTGATIRRMRLLLWLAGVLALLPWEFLLLLR